MSFVDYYTKKFRSDLIMFLEAMPESLRKHYGRAPESYSISPNFYLDPEMAIKVVPLDDRPNFAVSLYFTAVIDQSMHYHHRHLYERFRAMTDYPKLTGACPGGCNYMAHPTIVLRCINLFNCNASLYIGSDRDTIARSQIILKPIVEEATAYFLDDLPKFLRKYFQEISEPESFTRRIISKDYVI